MASARALRCGSEAVRVSCGEQRGDGDALTLGHRTDALVLVHAHAYEKFVAASAAPVALAEQQVGDSHAFELPWVAEDDLGVVQVATRDPVLDPGARLSNLIGALEGADMLRTVARSGIHARSTRLAAPTGPRCRWRT